MLLLFFLVFNYAITLVWLIKPLFFNCIFKDRYFLFNQLKSMNNKLPSYQGTDRLLFGMIFGVLAFWLFAQTTLNINVDMARELGMEH